MLWLNEEEKYWPGDPLEHLRNTIPQNKDGSKVDVPPEIFGKWECLNLPNVNHPDVFLCLNEDPRVNARIEKLMATHGKPDPITKKSDSTCWIIAVDKTKEVGEGTLDVFYFYFYPYNLGNTVAFTAFGNHVGDWEHSMVRFKHGEPIALHLSAHVDGHSWAWKTVEKMGDRPVGYVATGSHAMYGKPGSKHYSPVPVVGPVDHASRGVLWDPTLNYVAVSYDIKSETFSPLSAPAPTPTSTAPLPTPGATASTSAVSMAMPTSPGSPVYNTSFTPDQIVTVLSYKGRWGNSFSDVRETKDVGKLTEKFHDVLHFVKKGHQEEEEKRSTPTLGQRLNMLKWAEGPSGPRWKSLERVGATWNTTDLLPELV